MRLSDGAGEHRQRSRAGDADALVAGGLAGLDRDRAAADAAQAGEIALERGVGLAVARGRLQADQEAARAQAGQGRFAGARNDADFE